WQRYLDAAPPVAAVPESTEVIVGEWIEAGLMEHRGSTFEDTVGVEERMTSESNGRGTTGEVSDFIGTGRGAARWSAGRFGLASLRGRDVAAPRCVLNTAVNVFQDSKLTGLVDPLRFVSAVDDVVARSNDELSPEVVATNLARWLRPELAAQ